MSVVDDAVAAYNAWKEVPSGTYLERVIADSIVRDLVPALIHAAQTKPVPLGFGSDRNELSTDTEIVTDCVSDDEGEDE